MVENEIVAVVSPSSASIEAHVKLSNTSHFSDVRFITHYKSDIEHGKGSLLCSSRLGYKYHFFPTPSPGPCCFFNSSQISLIISNFHNDSNNLYHRHLRFYRRPIPPRRIKKVPGIPDPGSRRHRRATEKDRFKASISPNNHWRSRLSRYLESRSS